MHPLSLRNGASPLVGVKTRVAIGKAGEELTSAPWPFPLIPVSSQAGGSHITPGLSPAQSRWGRAPSLFSTARHTSLPLSFLASSVCHLQQCLTHRLTYFNSSVAEQYHCGRELFADASQELPNALDNWNMKASNTESWIKAGR